MALLKLFLGGEIGKIDVLLSCVISSATSVPLHAFKPLSHIRFSVWMCQGKKKIIYISCMFWYQNISCYHHGIPGSSVENAFSAKDEWRWLLKLKHYVFLVQFPMGSRSKTAECHKGSESGLFMFRQRYTNNSKIMELVAILWTLFYADLLQIILS